VLTGLLRDELGFDGVIATDSLRMEGVREKYGDARIPVLALQAGADVLLDPQQPDQQIQAVVDAVRSGELTERRIEQSVARILALKWQRGVAQRPFVDESRIDRIVGTRAHLARAQQITDRTTTLVTDEADLVPLPTGSVLVTGFGDAGVPRLAQELTDRGHPATGLTTGSAPDQAAIDRAVAAAEQRDLVVVTTSAARTSTAQQQLVAALRSTGKPVVVVAVRDAYDIAYLPGIESYLATYSSTPVAITSAAKVLAGDLRPRGRLPVDIPRADDPDEILFPFGTGLRS
jgi:beta-N-acetylhexosaminidase